MSRRPNDQKPPIFKFLNRKQLTDIFKYLNVEDLSRLRVTCRRMSKAVEHYVEALQVFADCSENYIVSFRQFNRQFDSFNLLNRLSGFVPHNPLGSPFD